jgi:acyl carrier protein
MERKSSVTPDKTEMKTMVSCLNSLLASGFESQFKVTAGGLKSLNSNNLFKPEDIKDNEPLFGEGLGLDSIDSLELIVLLGREYGITIQDPKEGRKVLSDVNTMVAYIEQHRTK